MRSLILTSLPARPSGRIRKAAAASLAVSVALVLSMLSVSPASATSDSGFSPVPTRAATGHLTAGDYIVRLKDAPAATYTGGVSGYSATRPRAGRQLDARSSAVKSYVSHLTTVQKSVASKYGIRTAYTYAVAYNGFAAKLTADQANALAADQSVASLVKSKRLKVQADTDTLTSKSPLNYLNIAGTQGLWGTLGGHTKAGAGVVIGEIDTGIAPENPSFAGAPLGTTVSTTEPYLSGSTIHYTKADGGEFTSTEEGGVEWSSSFYSQKIIAAKAFNQGFTGYAGLELAPTTAAVPEYNSPRDGDGHGSHTASTAAGDYGVDAVVAGKSFGTIAGVAPAAKLAIYKACWTAYVAADTGCDEFDLVAAINQAVTDGVDVINFSIGGGSASTIFSPTDEAFLNAAAAGIFVAAAAGNAGPGASTLDNAAPWETTVAASTAPSYEATLVLGNGHKYVGASITVDHIVDPDQAPTPDPYLTKHIVLATAAKKSSVSSAKAIDCRKGSLDAHKTAGKIVVCDRDGKVDRVEMSKTVKDAGGAGMVLLNTVKNSLDLDNHSIPTIHIDQPSRAAIRAYAGSAGSTATFVPENLGAATPVPQIAGFSSRGPVTAGGGDTLKPDIAAPGVAILAAVATTLPSGATPLTNNWAFYSGTSMATPHIAGIAALYLGNTPNASPSEIKSAMMTTAIDTVSASNAEVTDPFVQGAGEVIPSSLLNAGLFYLSTVSDWKSYVQGTGDSSFGPGVTAIDPSDLNQASIAIGSLVGHQTITRTVTAQSAGTFTAQISGMSGVDTVVTPSTLNFSAAGEQHSFTVTFTRTTAPVNKYSRGFLTWTFGTTKVRSPIAVKPVPVAAAVHGTGTNGHADVTASLGVKATVPLYVSGLAKKVVAPNPTDPSAGFTGHFATASQTGDPWGAASVAHVDHITTSTSYLRYSAESLSSSPGTDLDLYVFYSANSYNHDSLYDIMYDVFLGGTRYKLISSPNSAASETKSIVKPKAGYYISFVDPYALPVGGVDYNFATYNLRSSTSTGHFTASASSIHSTVAAENTFQVRWGGLAENSSYLGVVQYGTGSSRTIVTVDTADATPVENLSPPTVSGSQVVGSRLTGTAGTWNVASKYLSPLTWEWLRDGTPITGATTSTYTLTPDDFGHQVALRVTAGLGAAAAVVVETTPGAVVKARPAISFRFEDATISHTLPPQLFVSLSSNPSGPDVTLGQIKITYGSKSTTVDYVNSTDPIDLPLLKKGTYSVSVSYLGSDEIATGRSATHTLTVS